ncbi:MAG: hypothetical protein FWE27_06305 [Defluviitaleaceae bacterium]|nr:hypothetical protein [Defluviitaleaceae bacterium]
MNGSILITSKETEFGKNLAAIFAREGYEVFSPDSVVAQKITKLDFFAETTDFCNLTADNFSISSGIDGEIIEKTFRKNVIKPMATLEKFLPLLEVGETKRLFYVSSAEASINETCDAIGYGYKMSKIALHQFLQMLRNDLAPHGFTFRIFDPLPKKINPQIAAESAFMYITRRRGTENNDPNRDDETSLALRDAEGRHHAW